MFNISVFKYFIKFVHSHFTRNTITENWNIIFFFIWLSCFTICSMSFSLASVSAIWLGEVTKAKPLLLVSCKFSRSSILKFSRRYLVEFNPSNSVISSRTTIGPKFFTINVFFSKFLWMFGFSSTLLRFFPISSCVIVGFTLAFFTVSETKV